MGLRDYVSATVYCLVYLELQNSEPYKSMMMSVIGFMAEYALWWYLNSPLATTAISFTSTHQYHLPTEDEGMKLKWTIIEALKF